MENDQILELLASEFSTLEKEVQYALDKWIDTLVISDEYNYNHTSYGLAKCFERVSSTLGKPYCLKNDQLKYAMYQKGFIPDDITEENWCFKLAEKQAFNWE